MQAYILTTAGERLAISPSGKKFTLAELQNAVGGYIEIIALTDEVSMIVDEEGRFKDKDYNNEATKMLIKCRPDIWGDIVGNVLIVDNSLLD